MSLSDKTIYSEHEMLQLSGIQHYVFCPRQWALMTIEQVWSDNGLTAEGTWLHKNVDDPFARETSGSSVITLRGIRLASFRLGLSGIADAVEIIPFEDAPASKKQILKSKRYEARPVEYKRGKPKLSDCDRIQVACQAMILEEMLGIVINQGAVFYWEVRHREYFDISEEMRNMVIAIAGQMHSMVKTQLLPPAVKKKHCRSCSLVDYCLPSLEGKSAAKYLSDSFENEVP